MKLTEISLDRYGPLRRFTHTCESNFEVFYGPNESGKTLLIESILRLLEPEIDSVFPEITRVTERSSGYLMLESDDTEHKLGQEKCLNDVIDLSPRHLRNIFVIRDNDLRLQEEHEFYDAVTQRIGELHTNEIEAIQSQLVDSGRLTSVQGRRLSGAQAYHDAESVRDRAVALCDDIRGYIEDAEASDIAAAERDHIAVTAELHRCNEQLSDQQAAEKLDTHETLSQRLETYRDATDRLESKNVSQSTLERLQQLERKLTEIEEDLEEIKRKRATLQEERSEYEGEKEAAEVELTPLEDREEDIEAVEQAVTSFREAQSATTGATRGMRFAQYLALVALGFGGVAAILGSMVAGLVLIGIGSLAAVWYGLQHRAVAAAEQQREELLQKAKDAGLSVDEVAEIPDAIRDFRDERKRLRAQRDEAERQLQVKEDLIEDREQELQAKRKERRVVRNEKFQIIQEAGVSDLSEYRERVDLFKRLERERERAAQSLRDALGTLDDAGSDPEANIRYWRSELDARIAGVDDSVTAEDYDKTRLADLQETKTRLETRQEELHERLEEHRRSLEDFEERIQTLATEPFIGERIALSSRSIDGLRASVQELDRLIEQIERDADVTREALDIFDEIQSEEEQKIKDLFGDGSPAATLFGRLTENRYTDVTYDSATKVLQVHRSDGEVFTPRQLSQGTTDQLYLAARIGLAEQLLNSKPGFFILDDAFLPADKVRLRQGFQVLQELADKGWQIIYFTAKEEIGEDIVETRGLPCRRLETLE